MEYAKFIADVQRDGCFGSLDEAEAAVTSVLMAMAEVLPASQLETLSAALPPATMVYLRRPGSQPDPLFDSDLFLGWVVSALDATAVRDKTVGGMDFTAAYSGEEAIRRMQCVFAALKRQMEPDHQRELASFLPEQVDTWFLTA